MNNELVPALRNVTDAFVSLLRMVGEEEPECAPVVMAARSAIAKAEENARLAAAAPELFSALCLMLAQFADHEQYDDDGYDTEAINAARAAIAKAEGK